MIIDQGGDITCVVTSNRKYFADLWFENSLQYNYFMERKNLFLKSRSCRI